MLVRTFTLVGRVLGQSHVDLGLELVTQVAVLEDITVHKSVVFPSKIVQVCPPTPSEFNWSVLRVIQTFSRDTQTYLPLSKHFYLPWKQPWMNCCRTFANWEHTMANQKVPGTSWGGKHWKVFRQETFPAQGPLTFSNSILVMFLFTYLNNWMNLD